MVLRCSKCGRFFKQRTMSFLPPDMCNVCGQKSLPHIINSETIKEDTKSEVDYDEIDVELM